jgi:hypothetical protein
MRKEQRYRHEMFVRVRDFGVANAARFPESTSGGQMFAQVAAAVDAIEAHLTRRVMARTEASRVKATTREAVTRYMHALAATGRRVAKSEKGVNPFRMPARKSAASILAAARVFIEEAERRQAQFVQFGLPEGFIGEFRTHVDDLERAINAQLNSRSARRRAQAGIENTLADGLDVIRNLDVIVANVMRDDPTSLAGWDGARRIDGLNRGVPRPEKPPVETDDEPAADGPADEAEEGTPAGAAPVLLVPPTADGSRDEAGRSS